MKTFFEDDLHCRFYRLRMNKRTLTIKVDVYEKESRWRGRYTHTLRVNFLRGEKESFFYYYNNYATVGDVRQLLRQCDSCTYDFTPDYILNLTKEKV